MRKVKKERSERKQNRFSNAVDKISVCITLVFLGVLGFALTYWFVQYIKTYLPQIELELSRVLVVLPLILWVIFIVGAILLFRRKKLFISFAILFLFCFLAVFVLLTSVTDYSFEGSNFGSFFVIPLLSLISIITLLRSETIKKYLGII